MERYLTPDVQSDVQAHVSFDTSPFKNLDLIGTLSVIQQSGKSVVWAIGTGGSIDNSACLKDGVLYFGCCDHLVYAVALNGRERWRFKTNDVVVSAPTVEGERLYIGGIDHRLYCLSLGGGLVWTFQAGDSISCRPAVAGGRIFFGCKDGNLYCVSAEGKLLWKIRTQTALPDDPVFHEGRVYFSSEEKNFYCADALTGRLLWKFPTSGPILFERAIITGWLVIFGSTDNNIYALNATTGKLVWKFPVQGTPRSGCTDGTRVYVGCRDNVLYALTLEGRLVWTFKADHLWTRTPAVRDGVIYAGNADGNLYALTTEGRMLWKFATGGPVVATPILEGDRISFGSFDCTFYCVDLQGSLLWKFRTSMGSLAPVHLESLGPGNTFQLVIPQDHEPVPSEERYRPQFTPDDGSFKSQYVAKQTYVMKSQYAGGRRIKTLTSEE